MVEVTIGELIEMIQESEDDVLFRIEFGEDGNDAGDE